MCFCRDDDARTERINERFNLRFFAFGTLAVYDYHAIRGAFLVTLGPLSLLDG